MMVRAALVLGLGLGWGACETSVPPRAAASAESEPGEGRPDVSPDVPLVDVEPPDLTTTTHSAALRRQIRDQYASFQRTVQDPTTTGRQRSDAYGEMGRLLLATRRLDAAEPYLRNAERLTPDEARWSYYLGHLYRMRGETMKAAARFDRVLTLRADDVPARIWLGEIRLLEGRFDAAATLFADALSGRPASVAARYGLGRVALARGDVDDAIGHLEAALSVDPSAGSVHYSLAQAYRRRGDLERARRHLERRGRGGVSPLDPLMDEIATLVHSPLAYELRGSQALETGDLDGAVASFRQGLELAPEDAALQHKLGTALFLRGEIEEGLRTFERLVDHTPAFAKGQYSLGVLLASSGRLGPALERLDAAVRHDPTYVEARLVLADLLRRQGRTAEAMAHYEHILAIDPTTAEAWFGQAMLHVARAEFSDAAHRLIEARRIDPHDARLVLALVRLLSAAPDAEVRDGPRAMTMLQGLDDDERARDPESVAMALAEVGAFGDAVAWQRDAIAAARRAGQPEAADRMADLLDRYERSQPSRTPWRDGELP